MVTAHQAHIGALAFGQLPAPTRGASRWLDRFLAAIATANLCKSLRFRSLRPSLGRASAYESWPKLACTVVSKTAASGSTPGSPVVAPPGLQAFSLMVGRAPAVNVGRVTGVRSSQRFVRIDAELSGAAGRGRDRVAGKTLAFRVDRVAAGGRASTRRARKRGRSDLAATRCEVSRSAVDPGNR